MITRWSRNRYAVSELVMISGNWQNAAGLRVLQLCRQGHVWLGYDTEVLLKVASKQGKVCMIQLHMQKSSVVIFGEEAREDTKANSALPLEGVEKSKSSCCLCHHWCPGRHFQRWYAAEKWHVSMITKTVIAQASAVFPTIFRIKQTLFSLFF